MNQEKYNGWTNRETWLVNLHYSNIIDTNVNEFIYNEETEEHRQVTRAEIATYIEELFDILIEEQWDQIPSFFQDMIDLSLIDWYDLAEQYIDEVVE
jgi:hypothetical protein